MGFLSGFSKVGFVENYGLSLAGFFNMLKIPNDKLAKIAFASTVNEKSVHYQISFDFKTNI